LAVSAREGGVRELLWACEEQEIHFEKEEVQNRRMRCEQHCELMWWVVTCAVSMLLLAAALGRRKKDMYVKSMRDFLPALSLSLSQQQEVKYHSEGESTKDHSAFSSPVCSSGNAKVAPRDA
jgi:hypothetical protein